MASREFGYASRLRAKAVESQPRRFELLARARAAGQKVAIAHTLPAQSPSTSVLAR